MELNSINPIEPQMALQQRITNMQNITETFFKLANQSDLNVVYRNRQNRAKINSEEVVDCANNMLLEIPSSRQALLYFVGNLIHEHVHTYFLEQEGTLKKTPIKSTDSENRPETINLILKRLSEQVRELQFKETFPLEILNWAFEMFSELAKRNIGRPIFRASVVSASVFLSKLSDILCIVQAIGLMKQCFDILAKFDQEKAFSLLAESSKQNAPNLNWIFLTIIDSFPSITIRPLFEQGVTEFRDLCASMMGPDVKDNSLIDIRGLTPTKALQLNEEFEKKLMFFGDVFFYLAQKQNIEFKLFTAAIINKFHDGEENTDEMLFLIKLIINFPEIILPFVEEFLQPIDTILIQKFIRLASTPACIFALLPHNKFQEFIQKFTSRVGIDTLLDIIQHFPTFV